MTEETFTPDVYTDVAPEVYRAWLLAGMPSSGPGALPAGTTRIDATRLNRLGQAVGALSVDVRDALAALAGKYVKPSGGIPAADLASDVPTAAQVAANTAATQTNATAIAAKYTKPGSGIPLGDLATSVTTAFTTPAQVDARFSALVGAAPAALDTLAEIATQLGADESAASALAGRVTTVEQGVTANGTAIAAKTPAAFAADPAFSGTYAQTTDARFSDQRTPLDGSVTNAKVVSVAASKVTGLAAVATSGSAADLTGVLSQSALPPLAINDTFTVTSQAGMLALTAQRGDVAVRTDLTPTRMFLLTADAPSTLANWTEITAAGSVLSVAGRQGAVVLTKGDVGLDQVSNLGPAALADLDDFALAYAPRVSVIDTVITTATTLTANRHHKVDASAGPVTVTLPTPTRLGQRIRVEKVDSSANFVSITGTMRGVTNTTGTLQSLSRTIEFFAESLASWRPANSHHTDAALDARYEKLVTRATATAGQVPTLQGDGTLAFATPSAAAASASPMRGWPSIGEWMAQDAVGVADRSQANGILRVYPLWVPPGTYDAAAFHVTQVGSTGAVIKVVVYADSASNPGHPGTLLFESAGVDVTASTGVKQVTGLSLVAPNTGRLFWVGTVTQGAPSTAPSVRANTNGLGGAISASNLTNDGLYNLYATGYALSGVTASAPTAGPTVTDRDSCARMALRRSA